MPRVLAAKRRERPALVLRPRRLLRDPQGRAAGKRAGRVSTPDHRAQGVPVRRPAPTCRASRSTHDAQGGSRSTRWPTGPSEDLDAYFAEHDLPPPPAGGAKATPRSAARPAPAKVAPGEDPRSGRWRGWDKTECGIHVPGEPDRRRRAAAGLRSGVLKRRRRLTLRSQPALLAVPAAVAFSPSRVR